MSDNEVMTEFTHVEDALKESMHRIDVIERRLKTKLLTTKIREPLELELEELKEELKRYEDKLRNLRKENKRSFGIAAAIIFVSFLLYGLYSMFNVKHILKYFVQTP